MPDLPSDHVHPPKKCEVLEATPPSPLRYSWVGDDTGVERLHSFPAVLADMDDSCKLRPGSTLEPKFGNP